MALHTRKQFAKLAGVSPDYVSQYLRRGKLVLSGDKIDDAVEPNAFFLAKRRGRLKERQAELEINPDEFTQGGAYYPELEKHLATLMQDLSIQGKAFLVVPVTLAEIFFSSYLADLATNAMRREAALCAEVGRKVDPDELIRTYTKLAREQFEVCQKELRRTAEEIIEDHI